MTPKAELKTCNRVFVMAFHKAFNIMIAKKMVIVITIAIVHICAQQLNTYSKSVCIGVFCVISVQIAYRDTSLICGGSPCARSPFRGSSPTPTAWQTDLRSWLPQCRQLPALLSRSPYRKKSGGQVFYFGTGGILNSDRGQIVPYPPFYNKIPAVKHKIYTTYL